MTDTLLSRSTIENSLFPTLLHLHFSLMVNEEDLVRLAVFMGTTYAVGKLAENVKVSPVLAFVAVGALLGPPLANFIPAPDGVILSGLLGIQLSVVDAGLGTNLDDLRKSAIRALLVAVLGVLFPIAGSCLVIVSADLLQGTFQASKSLKTAFTVGAAIAPTSLGVTARLLAEVNELETPIGQLVSIAAVFDDVISLVLLAQVMAIVEDDPSVWSLIRPVVFSATFLIGSVTVALLLPRGVAFCFRLCRVPEQMFPMIGLWLLMSVIVGATYVSTLASTSFLLAGYSTGVAFAQIPRNIGKDPWKNHVEKYIDWLSIMFFAGTIGFVIPLTDLFSKSALGIGALLAVVAVFGKLFCGIGLLPKVVDGVSIGVAMLGRGEFGFLIASQARVYGLLDDRLYAATTWGVVVPTLLSPLIVGPVFKWRRKRQRRMSAGAGEMDRERLPCNEELVQNLNSCSTVEDEKANESGESILNK